MIDYLTNRDLVFKKLTNDPMFFTVVKHGSLPMILVTNPKVAWMVYPSNEPTGLSLSLIVFFDSHPRLYLHSKYAPIKEFTLRKMVKF